MSPTVRSASCRNDSAAMNSLLPCALWPFVIFARARASLGVGTTSGKRAHGGRVEPRAGKRPLLAIITSYRRRMACRLDVAKETCFPLGVDACELDRVSNRITAEEPRSAGYGHGFEWLVACSPQSFCHVIEIWNVETEVSVGIGRLGMSEDSAPNLLRPRTRRDRCSVGSIAESSRKPSGITSLPTLSPGMTAMCSFRV